MQVVSLIAAQQMSLHRESARAVIVQQPPQVHVQQVDTSRYERVCALVCVHAFSLNFEKTNMVKHAAMHYASNNQFCMCLRM
jgi:hypothetical protein